MAVRVGADNHQFDLRVVKHFVEVAGEVDVRILRCLFFRLCAAAIDMRHVPAVFSMQDIGKMVAGGAFAKSNKCAVQSHNAILI